MSAISKLALLVCAVLTTKFNLGASVSSPGNIFILAGQSNMAGRGGVTGAKWDGNVPPECTPNQSILRLSAQLVWEQAREPLHADIDIGKTCGVGPGMAFANEVLRAKGSSIGVLGLVPCAVGGTNIGQWARGGQLYTQLVRRASESVKAGGTIRAVLWYQGESDTVNRADAEAYKGNFERLVSDLRFDLRNPNLPIIQVALASGEGQFVDIVRKAQLGMTLPNVKCIDAKGLPLKPDNLHLTTMSEVHLGIKLANAFLASYSHQF
ncbi:probable carbohydrate esterase At4g34215 [Argentina anserina]|uniref:probable carbohydrate esterase At4g34215 n=1 Tax=Argentina anserina TaxID=57926 RepID=UPI0021765F09|nr:probable carbohydrate esterase At4g34215 [Potentilla anserina]